MPKLTKAQLKDVKYTSMADYYRAVDQIEDFDDKMAFTTRFLLSHGMDEDRQYDYSIEEAIHLARVKLMDTHKQLKDKLYNQDKETNPDNLLISKDESTVNPYAKDLKEDIDNQFFMGNPGEYLKAKAEKYAAEIEDQDIEMGLDHPFKENCIRLSKTLNSDKSMEIASAERKGMTTLNIQARLEAKYRGKENYRKAQDLIKPGFIAKVFGTRSTAGKNLDEVWAAFNSPKHALYGNKEALGKAATEYLAYKDSKKGVLERSAGLAVKEPKEGFAANLLEAIQAEKANEEVFQSVTGECYKSGLTAEKVDSIKGPEAEVAKKREPMDIDLIDDEEEELDNSADNQNEVEVVNDKQAEKEEDSVSM